MAQCLYVSKAKQANVLIETMKMASIFQALLSHQSGISRSIVVPSNVTLLGPSVRSLHLAAVKESDIVILNIKEDGQPYHLQNQFK